MNEIAMWIGSLLFAGTLSAQVGYCIGRSRELEEVLPELRDLREEVAKLKLLARMQGVDHG